MLRVCPVMKLASSEARKTTAAAISSGFPSLPNEVAFFSASKATGFVLLSEVNSGVSVGPGQMQFTLILKPEFSNASTFVNEIIPPFAAE